MFEGTIKGVSNQITDLDGEMEDRFYQKTLAIDKHGESLRLQEDLNKQFTTSSVELEVQIEDIKKSTKGDLDVLSDHEGRV
mmetsp:Transcript_35960/g.50951  ORF Transcript_35960/g.50951 Transcript_35960/m.50951 type:complete len:81 (-) Transcript_35960:847-1089(-)